VLRELKAAAATDTLGSELARVHRAVVGATGARQPALADAVTALLTHIDVYRCDYPALAATMSTPSRKRSPPGPSSPHR
jgi:(1->4)-alpha-D-glucan 1-alpha-D-glucosylmutase